MNELKITQTACNGKSCHQCEALLPGFIEKHKGRLQISDFFMSEYAGLLSEMIETCPTSALSLSEI